MSNKESEYCQCDEPIDFVRSCGKCGKRFAPYTESMEAATKESNAISDVIAERQRQKDSEGWTPKHDDQHSDGAIALAGAGYAHAAAWGTMAPDDIQFSQDDPPAAWPAEWNFKPGEPRRMLVKAAALIIAEIERIDRAAERNVG